MIIVRIGHDFPGTGYSRTMPDQPLTYASAGVDIESAQRSLRSLESAITSTYDSRVVSGIGGFGGLFAAKFPDIQNPILVASIDGVGSKTKVAHMMGDYSNIGRDIVHHSVNDILCQGAQPLFFLDYFACSNLEPAIFDQVVRGAAEACADLGCALLGGETAEMPGVYHDGEIDVVGSIVGIVDADARLPRGVVKTGDVLIALASDGLHTNGFSLARRALFDVAQYSVRDFMPHSSTMIGEELLRPHKCYLKTVHPLISEFPGIGAMAHITGGGLYDNIPRVLTSGLQAIIDRRAWTPFPIFKLIQEAGDISDVEMYRAFNMGIGMVMICDKDVAPTVLQRLLDVGEPAAIIGEIRPGAQDVQIT